MKSSYKWLAGNTMALVYTEETWKGTFAGICCFWIAGKCKGPWSGGRYGIGTEWQTEEMALKDLCCFLYWEIENHPEIDSREELLEKLLGSYSTASSTHDCRHDPVEVLINDLRKGRRVIAESIKSLKADLFYIPKTGEQIELF